jgi:hypothetical protein
MASYSVAIVVPLYKSHLSSDENVSINSFLKHLKGYNFHAVVPEHLVNGVEELPCNFQYTSFPDRYFQNIDSYSRLLLSKEFYTAFQKYDYILIAQTDALVFSSDLQAWCEKGWDYIGAPWGEGYLTNKGVQLEGVGNGGLSLRNVHSFIRVLNTKTSAMGDYSWGPHPRWWKWMRIKKLMLAWNSVKRFFPKITVEEYLRKYYLGAEDIFWGKYSCKFYPLFKVPSVDEALSFAIEVDPEGCMERTGGKLPFGCHAWARYDRGFWEKMGVVPEKGKYEIRK